MSYYGNQYGGSQGGYGGSRSPYNQRINYATAPGPAAPGMNWACNQYSCQQIPQSQDNRRFNQGRPRGSSNYQYGQGRQNYGTGASPGNNRWCNQYACGEVPAWQDGRSGGFQDFRSSQSQDNTGFNNSQAWQTNGQFQQSARRNFGNGYGSNGYGNYGGSNGRNGY